MSRRASGCGAAGTVKKSSHYEELMIAAPDSNFV